MCRRRRLRRRRSVGHWILLSYYYAPRLGTTTATATQCPSGHSSTRRPANAAAPPRANLRSDETAATAAAPLPQTRCRRGRRHAIIARDSRFVVVRISFFPFLFSSYYFILFIYLSRCFISFLSRRYLWYTAATRDIYKANALSEITSICCRNFPQ